MNTRRAFALLAFVAVVLVGMIAAVTSISIFQVRAPAFGPNQNVIYASPNCGTQANCVTVYDDGHSVGDATSNSSTTITCPNDDCNFTSTDAYGRPFAKVGQLVWMTNSPLVGGLVCPQTTIATVSANSITVNNTCTANASGTGILIWGDDDSTNLANAGTAMGNACTMLRLPSGYMLTQKAQFVSIPSACTTLSTDTYQGPALKGQGISQSWIIPTPNFDASTCTGQSNSCFGANSLSEISDFTIWGGGYERTNSTTTHVLLLVGVATRCRNVDVEGWGSLESNWTAIYLNGNSDTLELGGAINAGNAIGINAGGAYEYLLNNFVTGYGISLEVGGAGTTSVGGVYNKSTTGAESVYVTGTNFISQNDAVQSQNGASAVRVDGSAFFYGSRLGTSVSGTTYGLYIAPSTNGKAFAQNTTFAGGATAGNLDISSGGAFVDLGGNSYTSSGTSSISGSYVGEANSANAKAVTAAKLVLSAGWGSTAAWTSLSGGDFPIQGTITNSGTGQGASPTITYTFPTPLLVAPYSCTAVDPSGTNTLGTFTTSSLTATGVVFTFSLTPTVSDTEVVQITCVTP